MSIKPDYQRDGVVLFNRDCLEILPELTGVDAVITDPPYGINLRNGDVDGHRVKRSWNVANDDSQTVAMHVNEWCESRNLPTVFFASPWKPFPGEWRNLIVWDKGGAVGGGGDTKTCLKRSWELIQVARNKPMNGSRDESVWRHPIHSSELKLHICAKPVGLMERLILRFTGDGDCVLDPFLGSGTTGVAAVQCGRRFVGIEVDRWHFETAVMRIEKSIRERFRF